MSTTNFGWNNTVSGDVDINVINTTLDDIDTDIKSKETGLDRKFERWDPNVTGIFANDATDRSLDGSAYWILRNSYGSVGDVTYNNGGWSLSEGLWYCQYQIKFQTNLTALSEAVGIVAYNNLTQGSSDITQSNRVVSLDVSNSYHIIRNNFYIPSVQGGILSDGEIDPDDTFIVNVFQDNPSGFTAEVQVQASNLKFLYVRPL